MKYIDVDKLRAEIERRKKQDLTFRERNILIDIEMAIDSLQQEQPEVDLEEAAKQLYPINLGQETWVGDLNKLPRESFIEGAKWQKAKMMEGAVEGFIFQSADYYPKQLIAGYDGELGMGDKVHIIILPKEDKQ